MELFDPRKIRAGVGKMSSKF